MYNYVKYLTLLQVIPTISSVSNVGANTNSYIEYSTDIIVSKYSTIKQRVNKSSIPTYIDAEFYVNIYNQYNTYFLQKTYVFNPNNLSEEVVYSVTYGDYEINELNNILEPEMSIEVNKKSNKVSIHVLYNLDKVINDGN